MQHKWRAGVLLAMGIALASAAVPASAEKITHIRTVKTVGWVNDIAYFQNFLYYSDEENNTIQTLPLSALSSDEPVTPKTYASGFKKPRGIAVDPQGNLYVADSEAHLIFKVTPDGKSAVYAGDGKAGLLDGAAATARFHSPSDVAWGKDGALYVADTLNHRIRKITANGQVTTVAGSGDQADEDGYLIGSYLDGKGNVARLNEPTSLSFSTEGDLYFTDAGNQRIRVLTRGGEVRTIAGSGTEKVENRYVKGGYQNGKAAEAQFHSPMGIKVGDDGRIYVADTYNNNIRLITPAGQVFTLAGSPANGLVNGWGTTARFDGPTSVELLPNQSMVVADHWNRSLRPISLIPLPDRKTKDDIRLVMDGSPLLLKQKPVLIEGKVWVPLREMIEHVKGTVQYDPVTKKTVVVREGNPIVPKTESIRMIDGVTYVLASQLPSLLNAEVNWVSSYGILDIRRKAK